MSIKKKIESLVPNFLMYHYTKWKTRKRVKKWEEEGSPHFTLEEKSHQEKPDGIIGVDLPATKEIKNTTIHGLRDQFNLKVFVETGTFLGDMVEEQKAHFQKVYSIELNEALWEKAQKRFENDSHITLLCGDSGEVLGELVPKLEEAAVFWLDGHYSGGITAKGLLHTPIIKEMKAVAASKYAHVIIIDDARCFTGEDDYPTTEELRLLTKELFPNYSFEVKDDLVRIFPS